MASIEVYNDTGIKYVTPEPLAGDGGDLLNDNFKIIADFMAATGSNRVHASGVVLDGSNFSVFPTGVDDVQEYIDNLEDSGVALTKVPNTWTATQTFSSSVDLDGGHTTEYKTIPISALSMRRPGYYTPTLTRITGADVEDSGIFTEYFSYDVEESLYFSVVVPFDYKEGTHMNAYVKWLPSSSNFVGDGIEWSIEYSWTNEGDYIVPLATTQISDFQNWETNKLMVTTGGGLTGTGKKALSTIIGRIYRNVNGLYDNHASDIGLVSLELRYQSDTIGGDSYAEK